MSLPFEIFGDDSGVFSDPSDHHIDLEMQLGDLADAHEDGLLGDKPYLAKLERIAAAAPDFVRVHTDIAMRHFNDGRPKKTLDAAMRALTAANSQIPEGFSGRIEWGHMENRPYLRAMHLALLAYMDLRRHRDAVVMIDLLLARNPNDNQGVRFLLGSELMRAGDLDRARTVLSNEAADYPPYFYELALNHMLRGEWVPAATALRRGFVANPYIAEILAGNPNPSTLAIWHGNNFAEPETAHDYMRACGGLWFTQRDSAAFIHWLFNHPKVMVERAGVMACREALLWERDVRIRSKLVDDDARLVARIDQKLSTAIVVKRVDRNGKLVWPWEFGR